MNRLITLSIILSSAFSASAQDVNKTVTLNEVTVKAAKVVNKPDGMVLYPTDAQKQSSTTATAFLGSSRLPICVSTISTTPLRLSTTAAAFRSE